MNLVPVQGTAIAADTLIKTGPGALVAVVLSGAASQIAAVIIYDNTSAAGTKLLTLTVAAGETVCFTPCAPIVFGTGIYADVDGTGVTATIAFI